MTNPSPLDDKTPSTLAHEEEPQQISFPILHYQQEHGKIIFHLNNTHNNSP